MSGTRSEDNIHQQKLSSIVDIHICGGCRAQFSDVDEFLNHKRQTCPILSMSSSLVAQAPDPADPQFIQLSEVTQSTVISPSTHFNIAQPQGHEYLCSGFTQPPQMHPQSVYKTRQQPIEEQIDNRHNNEVQHIQFVQAEDRFANLESQLNSHINSDICKKVEKSKTVFENHEDYSVQKTSEGNSDISSIDQDSTDVSSIADSHMHVSITQEEYLNGQKPKNSSKTLSDPKNIDRNKDSSPGFTVCKGKLVEMTKMHQTLGMSQNLHTHDITVTAGLQSKPGLLTKTSTSQIASGLLMASSSESLQQKSNRPETLCQLGGVVDKVNTMVNNSSNDSIQQILTAAQLSRINTGDTRSGSEQVLAGHIQVNTSCNQEYGIIRQPDLLQAGNLFLRNIPISQQVAKEQEVGLIPTSQNLSSAQNVSHAPTVPLSSNIQNISVHENSESQPEKQAEPSLSDIQMIQKQLKDISQQIANSALQNDNQIINMLLKKGIPHEILNQVFSTQQQTLSPDVVQQPVLQTGLLSHSTGTWNQVTPQNISLEQLTQGTTNILAQKNLSEKLPASSVPAEGHMITATGPKKSTVKGRRQKSIVSNITKPTVQSSASGFIDSMNEEVGFRSSELLEMNSLLPSPEKQMKNGGKRQFSEGDVSFETQQTLKAMLKQNLQPVKTEPSQGKWKIQTLKKPKSKSFTCHFDNCTYQSAYQKDLDRHLRIHTGERPYACQFCEKCFNRKDKLKLHLRGHTGNKPYRCTECNYCAADGSSLKKHIRIHTGERPFKCQVCPYASRNSSQLIIHLRTHTGDAPFQCPVCASHFKINSDLKRHLRIHTGEKPFKCEQCDYKCSIKGNLKSHIRINHSGENNMKCDSCEFSTSSRKLLREHMKEHDPEENLKCSVCGYHCTNSTALKNHFRTHCNEKPYKCDHCSYSTKQSGNVRLHIKRKHPEMGWRRKSGSKRSHSSEKSQIPESKTSDPSSNSNTSRSPGHVRTKCTKAYKCTKCDAAFVREDSLRSHLRQHKVMANSSLSTALTVLRLQQPVINNPITAPSQVIDSQVISDCSISFTDTVRDVSSLGPPTSSESQSVSSTVPVTSSGNVNDNTSVSQAGLVNTGVTLQDLLAAAGIAGNVPSSPYFRSGQSGSEAASIALDIAPAMPAPPPLTYMPLPSPDQTVMAQQNIHIPIIDFASGQIVTVEGQLTEPSSITQPPRTEHFTTANTPITLNTDPIQMVATAASHPNYPLNLVSRVIETTAAPAIEKNTPSMPSGPFQLMLPSGESVTATLLGQTPDDTIQSSPSLNLPTSVDNISVVGSGSATNSGMTLLSIPVHLIKNIATPDIHQTQETPVPMPSQDMTVVQEVVVDLCDTTETVAAGTGECQTENK